MVRRNLTTSFAPRQPTQQGPIAERTRLAPVQLPTLWSQLRPRSWLCVPGPFFAAGVRSCERSPLGSERHVWATNLTLPVVPICRRDAALLKTPNHKHHPRRPASARGALRDRHERGVGCDGRVDVTRRRTLTRTTKPCGPDTPGLVLSVQKMICARR